jgi:hypothetical protein
MITNPKRLPQSAVLDNFTPDTCEAWFVAYAGPCGDAECDKPHTRLFLMPMVGWIHVVQATENTDEIVVRPAIMPAGGEVVDYLQVPDDFVFIAVVPRDENSIAAAKEIYRRRFGAEMPLVESDRLEASAN